jgi:hypothetical protein
VGLRIKLADLEDQEPTEDMPRAESPEVNLPRHPHPEITQEEAQIEFDEDVIHMPALVGQEEDDSVSESSDVDYEMDDDESDPDDHARFEEELAAQEQLEAVINTDSSGSSQPNDNRRAVPVRRTARENAGVQRYDSNYEWNLMNLSVGAAIRNFGDTARYACKDELIQLFK